MRAFLLSGLFLMALLPYAGAAGEVQSLMEKARTEEEHLARFDQKVSLFLEGKKARDGDGFGSKDFLHKFILLMKDYPGLSESRSNAMEVFIAAPDSEQDAAVALAPQLMQSPPCRHIQEGVALLAQSKGLNLSEAERDEIRKLTLDTFLEQNRQRLPETDAVLADLRILNDLARGGFIPAGTEFENWHKQMRNHSYEAGDAYKKDLVDELHEAKDKAFDQLTPLERKAAYRLYRRHLLRVLALHVELKTLYGRIRASLKK